MRLVANPDITFIFEFRPDCRSLARNTDSWGFLLDWSMGPMADWTLILTS